MNIVAVEALDQLLPAVQHLIDELKAKQEQYWHVVKVGRTHLQDATPLTFGQEVSGYVAALEHDRDWFKRGPGDAGKDRRKGFHRLRTRIHG